MFSLRVFVLIGLLPAAASAKTLTVGAGKQFEHLEQAYDKARAGDVIEIHPNPDNEPYARIALLVTRNGITFRGVTKDGSRIRIDGAGYDYSGRRRVPRAIFEFRKGADGCRVENLELYNARNGSANGAGIRVNQANDLTVLNCEVHHCDNGAMSNGDVRANTASNLRFVNCHFHHNGSPKHPGRTHNLYVGGTSIFLRGCCIHDSTTGHNFKSRAHYVRIEGSYLHDAAEREIDLPEDRINTAAANSDAVVIGCILVKKRKTEGNKGVFFFGGEKASPRSGTLYAVHNTIVTPYTSSLVVVTHADAKVRLHNNIVWSDGVRSNKRTIAAAFRGGQTSNVVGSRNWFAHGYQPGRANALSVDDNVVGAPAAAPPFRGAPDRDFRLAKSKVDWISRAIPLAELKLPGMPNEQSVNQLWQFQAPLGARVREDAALGALPVR